MAGGHVNVNCPVPNEQNREDNPMHSRNGRIGPIRAFAAGHNKDFCGLRFCRRRRLPNSLYHIINLATDREETNAEAEAA
jgi:hypothetical protein